MPVTGPNTQARLGSHKDVRREESRPTPEGDEFPHGPNVLPPLRTELLGVLAPDVRVAVYQVSVAVDDVALSDKDGRFLVGTTANGQRGVSESDADHSNFHSGTSDGLRFRFSVTTALMLWLGARHSLSFKTQFRYRRDLRDSRLRVALPMDLTFSRSSSQMSGCLARV